MLNYIILFILAVFFSSTCLEFMYFFISSIKNSYIYFRGGEKENAMLIGKEIKWMSKTVRENIERGRIHYSGLETMTYFLYCECAYRVENVKTKVIIEEPLISLFKRSGKRYYIFKNVTDPNKIDLLRNVRIKKEYYIIWPLYLNFFINIIQFIICAYLMIHIGNSIKV